MKIAVFVAELDIKGGTHKQVLRLAQHLDRQGHRVTILTRNFDPASTYSEFADLDVRSVAVVPTRHRVLARLASALALLKLAWKAERVDLLNIHDNRGVFFFACMRVLGRMSKTVWQINDLNPAFRVGNAAAGGASRRQAMHRSVNRWMARRVDRITVNVRKNRERVREHLGVDATVVHCGVDLPASFPPPQQPGAQQTLEVLSIGVFFRFRNYERLVDACAQAQDRLARPLRLTLVGDTRYDPAYADDVRRHAVSVNVDLAMRENLSDDELAAVMLASHVFAFVNIDQSWGLAVFEAAAFAKPVVLSRSVGAAELLADRAGIVLVDPLSAASIADALVGVLRDPARCSLLGGQAQAAVREMTWEAMYCRPVERLFEALAAASEPAESAAARH